MPKPTLLPATRAGDPARAYLRRTPKVRPAHRRLDSRPHPGSDDRATITDRTMKTLKTLCSLLVLAAAAQAADARLYEMRTYYAAPGRFDAMQARFRQHACRLFERHGIANIGYWTPLDEKDGAGRKLVYVIAHPSREAREKAWKNFMADPEWQAAFKASEVNGKLVEKVEVQLLTATDYSPAIAPPGSGGPRVFELRTYTAAPGRLDALNARFRNHTVKLFDKHGIQNIAYWTPAAGEQGAEDTLIYFVAHPSREAAAESFKKFGADPVWEQARKESEEKAGGSLTAQGGVKSEFMQATDYSPLQ